MLHTSAFSQHPAGGNASLLFLQASLSLGMILLETFLPLGLAEERIVLFHRPRVSAVPTPLSEAPRWKTG